jgi:hypothetical protein
MRTLTVYDFAELPLQIRDKLIERERVSRYGDNPVKRGILASLMALYNLAGIEVGKDYFLSPDPRKNEIWLLFPSDDVANLTGPRALAWTENHLYAGLRVPWTGPKRRRYYRNNIWPGHICPHFLTGHYADHQFLGMLRKYMLDELLTKKATLRDAFSCLAIIYSRLVRQYEEASDEAIAESFNLNSYLSDGTMIDIRRS